MGYKYTHIGALLYVLNSSNSSATKTPSHKEKILISNVDERLQKL